MDEATTTELLQARDRSSALRMGMVEVISILWPDWLKAIEQQLGKRMSQIPDDILLAYLQAACKIHTEERAASPNDINELERACRDVGIPIQDGTSHAGIAAAIRTSFNTLVQRNRELTKERNAARKAAGTSKATDTRRLKDMESSAGRPSKSVPFDLGDGKSDGVQQRLPGVFDIDDMDIDTSVPSLEDKEEQERKQAEQLEHAEELLTIPEEIRKRIAAGVKSTTPRFMADIVSITDSAEISEAWEKAQRRGKGDISFINAQDKHRPRGALLVPKPVLRDQIPGFSTSPWGRALEFGYRGGRLFDIATVLRKLGSSVVAVSFKEYAVEVIVSEAQGHYGLVIALSDGSEWYDTGAFVQELAVDSDVSKIVIIECQANCSEEMVRTLGEISRMRGWKSPVGVMRVALTSWLASGISRAADVPLG